MTPYWQDDTVTLHLGKAEKVLPTLPDQSVDAVVCDPPYGLEFMGKDWDRPWSMGKVADAGVADGTPFRRHVGTPSWSGSGNPICRNCGGTKYDRTRPNGCKCNAPSFPNEAASQMLAFQAWCEQWAREALRVLKPGGHMLAFGGTRTWHRLACAIEDAGFEIRDTIMWIHGQGFPKSRDVSKDIDRMAGAERKVVGTKLGQPGYSLADNGRTNKVYGDLHDPAAECAVTAPATEDAKRWDGWGTALKPSFEPVICARRPLQGTVAANVLTYGTGGINVAACRVAHASDADLATSLAKNPGRSDLVTSGTYGGDRPQQSVNTAGRWPTNLVLTHSESCADRCDESCPVAELDRQSGVTRSSAGGAKQRELTSRGYKGGGIGQRKSINHAVVDDVTKRGYPGEGGASRFYPVFRYEPKAPAHERPKLPDGTAHPTVKPLDLVRWLVRLVTPPGGLVLDMFAGTGTTGEACVVEGFRAVLVEQDPVNADLARTRLTKPIQPTLGGDAA